MYAEHVPIINGAMRRDFATFKRGVMFAILSARVQFNRVPGQVEDVEARGIKSRALWNWKYDAYLYIEAHGRELWQSTCAASDPYTAITTLCQIPGLGIVKAAFIAQMLGHDTACLDARNIAREGRNPRAFRTDGIKRGPAFERKVHKYCVETHGQAERYWNEWCEEVGPDYGMTAEQCSREHVTAIVPPRLRKSWAAPVKREEIPF